jgi:hypothetical protein
MQVDAKPDFLIDSIWILETCSGICIFEENYVDFTKEGLPTDMVGSFLTALSTFADEAFVDRIQHIKFSNRKIIFRTSKYFFFVIAISDDEHVSESQFRYISDKIIAKFNERYEAMFENQNWTGNVTIFRDFSTDLKEIVKKEPLKIKFFEYFDFKDSMKKIESLMKKKRDQFIKKVEKVDKIIEDLKIKKGITQSLEWIKHKKAQKNDLNSQNIV